MKKIYVKLSSFIVTAAILILLDSCASTPKSTPRPDWVSNPESVYSVDEYIAKVGEGYTKTEAVSDASLELGKYFGQNVKSSVTGRESSSLNSDGDYKNIKTVDKEYNISFDVDLFAVSKSKPWFDVDSELYYVCAYLNREQAFEIYKPTLIEAKSDFYNFYNEGISETDFFKKLNLLKSAEKIGTKYMDVLNFAQIILPSVSTVYRKDYEDIASVKLLISQLMSSAAVKISVNYDYGSKVNDFISKVFSNKGFNISNSNYQYFVDVVVDSNKRTYAESGIIVAEPSVTISLVNDKNDDIIFTYTRNFEKMKSYSEDNLTSKTFNAIINELESSFEDELLDFLAK